ncbi:MAG: glycine cleavage T C-terminal barrel domain-containing protein [Gemmatimonadales bacterium]|jgi:folate-binding protein YgfZ
MPTDALTPVHFLGPGTISIPEADAALREAGVSTAEVVAIGLTGTGAVECTQAMVTADIVKPGKQSLAYGAMLTPKGMIVTDLWTARDADGVTLYAPSEARDALFQIFARSLPPRLARARDCTDETQVLRLVGPMALLRAERAGLPIPEAGRLTAAEVEGLPALVGRPPLDRPFALQLTLAREHTLQAVALLERAKIAPVRPEALDLARLVSGWPRLGAEVDAKTLPQEVRFDEHGGVSYTKGCYTGQETVARLHFRGHANRWLGGLSWTEPPQPSDHRILRDGTAVGRVSSVAWLPRRERWIGLGLIRREVGPGQEVDAAGSPAMTAALPFEIST